MTTTLASPLCLTDLQKKFGPDNTTWQFVRLSPKYRAAFDQASKLPNDENALAAIKAHIKEPSHVCLAAAQNTDCREQFGLSAWLHPEHEFLPPLKSSGDSWFFPLKRLVLEDHRTAIPDAPQLIAEEHPFGYGRLVARSISSLYDERMIWVAIDCSVPPDGQLSALKTLAKKHRKYWSDQGLITTDASTFYVENVGWEGVFENANLPRPRDLAATEEDMPAPWQVVGINVLGSITAEIKACRRKLTAYYKKMRTQNKRATPWPLSFPRFLKNETDTPYTYLKAYLEIAQAAQKIEQNISETRNHPPPEIAAIQNSTARESAIQNQIAKIESAGPNDIARSLDVFGSNFRSLRLFEEQIETHIQFAKELIKARYRWLIHAQISFRELTPSA